MNSDIRIEVTWLCNIKRKALIRRLGHKAAIALIDLWIYAAQNRPKGDLTGMTDEEIADAAQWDGDPAEFVGVIGPKPVGINFLDGTPGNYELHDWEEHQPFVYHAAERSEAARIKALKRWGKDSNAIAMPQHKKVYAPNPNPNPNPNPSPTPKPKREGDKSPPALKFLEAARQIFPEASEKNIILQAQALEEIERLDRFIDTNEPITLEELLPALIWARQDLFWGRNFRSCCGLRKRKDGAATPTKWEKIYAQWEGHTKRKERVISD